MQKKFSRIRTEQDLEELLPLSEAEFFKYIGKAYDSTGTTQGHSTAQAKYDQLCCAYADYRREFKKLYEDQAEEFELEEKFARYKENRDKDIKIKLRDYMKRISKGDPKTIMSVKEETFLDHCGAKGLILNYDSSKTVGEWYDWYREKLTSLYGIKGRAPNKKRSKFVKH